LCQCILQGDCLSYAKACSERRTDSMETNGMGHCHLGLSWIGAIGLLVGIVTSAPGGAEGEDVPVGRAVFLEAKCNVCHAVPAAGIEAKTTSEKMRGPILGGALLDDVTFEDVAAYLRKLAERGGAKHKKEFKGSDEELQSILDWLATLEAAAAEG